MRYFSLLLLIGLLAACDKTPPPEPPTPRLRQQSIDNWTGENNLAILPLGDRMIFAGSQNSTLYVTEWSPSLQLLYATSYNGTGLSGARFMFQEGAGVLIGGYRNPDPNTQQAVLWRYTPQGSIAIAGAYGPLGETTFLSDGIQLPSGNRLLAGSQTDSSGNRDLWLAEVDLTGTMLWQRTYGGPYIDGAHRLFQGPSNIWVLGYTENRGAGSRDLWVMPLDQSLDTLYSFTAGGAGYEQAGGLVFAPNGDLILAAHTASNDPNHNLGVFRVTQQGTEVWRNEFGGANHDGTEDVLTLPNGNYLVLGNTESYGAGQSDIALIEVDNDGAIQDTFITGSADFDEGMRLVEWQGKYWIAARSYNSASAKGLLLQWDGF